MAENVMNTKVFNCHGEEFVVKENELPLKHPSYGFYDEEGVHRVAWAKEDDTVDGRGFDKSYKGNSPKGYTDIRTLPVGTMLARYGGPGGHLTTTVGTAYEKLGMPYIVELIEYHEYRVIAEFTVEAGLAAPMFDSPGGGDQFFTVEEIGFLCNIKCLEEDFTWLDKLGVRKE